MHEYFFVPSFAYDVFVDFFVYNLIQLVHVARVNDQVVKKNIWAKCGFIQIHSEVHI